MSNPRRGSAEASPASEVVEISTPRRSAATRRRRGPVAAAVVASLALVLTVGGIGLEAAHKSLILQADGRTIEAGTFTGDVASLLAEQGIEVGEHDAVSPALDAPLADDTTIEVVRARAVNVVRDGVATVLWTTEEHAGAALAKVADPGELRMAVSRSADRAEIDLPLAGTVRIVHMDGEVTAQLDRPTQLQALLDTNSLLLNPADELNVARGEAGATVVTIVRWDTTETTESEVVAHKATTVESAKLKKGVKKVTTEGVDGRIDRVYEVTTRDGVPTEKKLLSETLALAPVDEVTTVGTLVEEDTASAIGGGVWAKLAQCESGGNPRIVSSNGRYHGLYQFTVSTWRSVGGSGLPSEASAAEQTKRARMLQAKAGWGQWPACSRRLGLR